MSNRALVPPPINHHLRYQEMSKLLELHVGYASPLASSSSSTATSHPPLKHEENEIYFNFHLHINGFHWQEVIEYSILYHLHENIIPFTDDEQLNHFPTLSIDEYASVHHRLQENLYEEESLKFLHKTALSLETWMYTVFIHLHKIDEESRQMCKQLFFRSEEKLVKFDYLLKVLKNKEFANGRYGGNGSSESLDSYQDNQYQGINKVFKNMASLFTFRKGAGGGGGDESERLQPKLSEKNLVKLTQIQETKAVSKSVDRTNGQHHGPPIGSSKKKQSIFARSLGTKSAKDKQEDVDLTFRHTALDVAKNTALLKVEVTRGNEALQGVVWYDIILRTTGKKAHSSTMPPKTNSAHSNKSDRSGKTTTPSSPSNIYKTSQRFSAFKKLWVQLNEVNQQLMGKGPGGRTKSQEASAPESIPPSPYQDFIQLIKAPFPALPMKCYLGFSLTESELSKRTRMLDEWFRDVCYNYKNMPAAGRLLVRNFLKFEANRATDAFFQDQLAWGTIEVNAGQSGPIIVLQQNILDSVPEDLMEEIEAMSQMDGGKEDADKVTPLLRNQVNGSVRGGVPIDKTDSRTVYSRNSHENGELQNLIWETASQGGKSKLPIKTAKGSRTVIRR